MEYRAAPPGGIMWFHWLRGAPVNRQSERGSSTAAAVSRCPPRRGKRMRDGLPGEIPAMMPKGSESRCQPVPASAARSPMASNADGEVRHPAFRRVAPHVERLEGGRAHHPQPAGSAAVMSE
jgi:hypothetical protein